MTHGRNAEMNLDQLTGIRPFVVAVDEQLTITWASESVLRRAENALGLKVSDIVEPVEPREEISPSSIARNMGMPPEIFLKSGGCSTPLMGEWFSSRGGFILMANPDVRTQEDLDKFSFDDFSENDPTIELMMIRDEHTTSLREARSTALTMRQERDFSESLVNTAQAIILVLDPEGQIVRFNQYMEELSGYSLAEVRGKDWFSTFLPAKDHARIRTLFQNTVAEIQTGGEVNPIVTKDGIERTIEWYNKTLKDVDGNVIGVLSIGQDVTERKRAERELQDSEEWHRVLFESSRDAIMTLNLHSLKFDSGNPAAAKIFGCRDVEELTSLGPASVAPEYQPDGRLSSEKAKEMIETAVREGSNFFGWMHKRLDGKEFPTTVLLARMEMGGQTLLQATVRDVTEHKEAEERLNKKIDELERFNRFVVDREQKMIELKEEANRLLVELGGKPKYKIIELSAG